MRANARVRIGTQVLVLLVWVVWVRSPWMAAFFFVRWVPIVLVLLAAKLLPRVGRVRAVSIAAVGQVVAAVATVVLLPEFVPIVVLVMFGDLQLAKFLDRRHALRYLIGFLVVVAAVGLLSLQSWTGLADSVPRSVLVAVVVIHTASTGLVSSRFARESYLALRRQADELRRLGSRFFLAADDERERVSHELERGALHDLADLATRLGTIDHQLDDDPDGAAAAAHAAASEAQRALGALRSLSHGVFPDALRQFGLHQALHGLLSSAPAVGTFEVPDRRIDASAELALYGCAAEVARLATSAAGTVSVRVEFGDDLTTLEVWCEGAGPSAESFRSQAGFGPIVDRVGAVGGEAAVEAMTSGFKLSAQVPTAPTGGADDAALGALSTPADPAGSLLARFNVAGVMLSAFGAVVSTTVALATGNRSAGVVATVLMAVLALSVVSLVTVRRGHVVWSVYALAVSTSAAALVMTAALPRFVPMNALLAVVPMALVLPHLAARALNFVAALQTATLAGVALLALRKEGSFSAVPLPDVLVTFFVPFGAAAVAALVAYTELMTHAEMADRTAAVRAALRRVVNAADHERRRVERDLHDGAQQHFVALSMQCRVLARLATTDAGRAHGLVTALLAEIGDARTEVLDLVAGRFPELLESGRVADALTEVASTSPIAVEVRSALTEPVPLRAASAVYFACREAIQNAAKHAGPTARVTVHLRDEGQTVAFEVGDDGAGFDPSSVAPGAGFRSLRDRLEMAGGSLTIRSAEGEGTTLSGVVPR
ncbi:MAG: hypothetical protein RLZ14_1619 [Actinomycetota bacterium]